MTYRDEHDALYEKNEALERRLEAAQKEIDRLRAEQSPTEAVEEPAPPASADDQTAKEPSAAAPMARPHARSGMVIGLMAAAVVTTSAAAMLASRAALTSHYYRAYGGYGCPRRAVHSGAYGAYQTRGIYESHQFSGRVAAATGGANVAEGDRCTVTVSPVWSQRFNCRVQVECGGETLYGLPREGFTRCAVEDESPVRARDYGSRASDGDPELEFDVAARKVIVADSSPDETSFVSITLDPTP